MQMFGNNPIDLDVYPLLTAVGAFLETATVELFQNDIEPTRDLEIGDYTLADYTGYAAEAVTFNAPSEADDGSTEMVGVVGEFRPTASTVQNSIYGFLLLGSGGELVAAARFDNAPLSMGGVLDAIVVTPRLRLTLGGEAEVVS